MFNLESQNFTRDIYANLINYASRHLLKVEKTTENPASDDFSSNLVAQRFALPSQLVGLFCKAISLEHVICNISNYLDIILLPPFLRRG